MDPLDRITAEGELGVFSSEQERVERAKWLRELVRQRVVEAIAARPENPGRAAYYAILAVRDAHVLTPYEGHQLLLCASDYRDRVLRSEPRTIDLRSPVLRNPLLLVAVAPAAARAIWLATQGQHDRIWFVAAAFVSGFATAWMIARHPRPERS
jgi:hypothetical protein